MHYFSKSPLSLPLLHTSCTRNRSFIEFIFFFFSALLLFPRVSFLLLLLLLCCCFNLSAIPFREYVTYALTEGMEGSL